MHLSLAPWAVLLPLSLAVRDQGILYTIYNANLGLGAAYGTAKSGVGLSAMGVLRPDLLVKCIVPVVMAGILGIYGVVVSVLLSGGRKSLHIYFNIYLNFFF